MTSQQDIPPEGITEGETLGRELFSRRHAKKKIPLHAFIKAVDNKGISINRMDFADNETMVLIGQKNAEKRPTKPDGSSAKFYGWAELSVLKAMQENRVIQYGPEEDNPYHCDIILPADNDIKNHAQSLADSSTWKVHEPS